jgi:hypothetical protein
LRYGPRFKQGAVSVSHSYHEGAHFERVNPAFLGMTKTQRAFASAKGAGASERNRRIVSRPKKVDPRRDAEERMVERIKKAKEILEFGLAELMEVATPSTGYHHGLYQSSVLDIIRRLCESVNPKLEMPTFRARHARPSTGLPQICESCGDVSTHRDSDGHQWCDSCGAV